MDVTAVVIWNSSAEMIFRGQRVEIGKVTSKTSEREELAGGEATNPIIGLLMNKGISASAPS